MDKAFNDAKRCLLSAVSLAHPSTSAKISLAVDASATHVGAVLQQMDRGGWRPLAFFSRKLQKTEMKYSAFDRELLAAYLSVRHFRFMLEGRQFTLYTDHKPLVAAWSVALSAWCKADVWTQLSPPAHILCRGGDEYKLQTLYYRYWLLKFLCNINLIV
jgi:hypothetical protein